MWVRSTGWDAGRLGCGSLLEGCARGGKARAAAGTAAPVQHQPAPTCVLPCCCFKLFATQPLNKGPGGAQRAPSVLTR